MSTIVPCKDCLDRELGCHSKCLKYQEWKNQHDAEQQMIRQKAKAENVFAEYQINELRKLRKGIGRKRRK